MSSNPEYDLADYARKAYALQRVAAFSAAKALGFVVIAVASGGSSPAVAACTIGTLFELGDFMFALLDYFDVRRTTGMH